MGGPYESVSLQRTVWEDRVCARRVSAAPPAARGGAPLITR